MIMIITPTAITFSFFQLFFHFFITLLIHCSHFSHYCYSWWRLFLCLSITGKPLKIDALRVAIKDYDLKIEAANAEAAAALLSMQNASALSFNRVARRGKSC